MQLCFGGSAVQTSRDLQFDEAQKGYYLEVYGWQQPYELESQSYLEWTVKKSQLVLFWEIHQQADLVEKKIEKEVWQYHQYWHQKDRLLWIKRG